jgi:hypothetical protein
MDATTTSDAATMADVTTTADATAAVDAAVDGGSPDVPGTPPQVILGLVRDDVGTLYRLRAGATTSGEGAAWNTCPAGSSFIGRNFWFAGFWLCAANDLVDRRFYVGNVLGGVNEFWSLQRGNVTSRGVTTRDACPAGSALLGRSGDANDGFWVCMEDAMVGRYARAWEFNVDGDLAGWTPNGSPLLTVMLGRVNYLDTSGDPFLFSPNEIDLDASNTLVYVGLRSGTASTEARLFFVPDGNPDFTMSNSIGATTIPFDTSLREIVFDMSTHPEWRGTIRRLRVDPGNAVGSYSIDYIRAQSPSARSLNPYWSFDTSAEGWVASRGGLTWAAGALTHQVTGDDCAIESGPISVPADSRTRVRMRVRNGLPETGGEVFFATSTAPGFAASRSARFSLIASDNAYREYVAQMTVNPAWGGTITKIRVDFGATSRGDVAIDWIGLDE